MVKDTEDWMMACVKCGDPDEVPEKKSTFAASPWYVRQVETRCKVLYLVDGIQTLRGRHKGGRTMTTMVELQTPGEMDRLLHEAAVLEGITYRQALARTLERAAGRIDDVLLSAAQRRLEELRGKPAPVITEVVL